MTKSHPFRYVVLRYLHDRRVGEFVNLGVVVECASAGFLAGKFDSSFQRLTKFFPGVSDPYLRAKVKDIERHVAQIGDGLRERGGDIFDLSAHTLDCIWRRVLPCDDSALSWSEVKVGITTEPSATLSEIFSSVVERYKHPDDRGSRSDSDVWAKVEPVLKERGLQKYLESHEVTTSLSSYRFDHAMRNGKWHCIEPVSVDLSAPDFIRKKVQRIYGAMTLIEPSARDVKVYFVLSDPTTPAAKQLYQEAHGVISSAKIAHEVFRENAVGRLGDTLAEYFS